MEGYPIEYYHFFVSFNEGDYYTCHDLLEDMWMTDKENYFLKGLLQMSVAVYHYEYGNVKGARLMMQTAELYLQPYQPMHWGLDLNQVMTYIGTCLSTIPSDVDKVPYEHADSLPVLPRLYLYLQE